jgi:heme/copper-type cytochrome/quinol oxidase subunit 3
MTELADHSTDYGVVEGEPPEVMTRNLRVAAHLWSSATVFFFAAFLFAYFYLRSLDKASVFRPKHVDPSATLGTLVAVALVGSALLLWLGLADHRAERRSAWRVKGVVALVLLLAGAGLQIAEWATQGFGPTDGAYASVYIGWTALLAVFTVGLAFWVETTVATSIRYRGLGSDAVVPEGHGSGDADRTAPDIASPVSLVRPELEALSTFASCLAGVGVVTWVILYLL